MTPDAHLLFRFSAMTYNAHRIHLDRAYARNEEGYRDMLVHGPLSLYLMLKVLSSQISTGRMIRRLSYRNLAPMFCDEPLTVCVRRVPQAAAAEDGAEKWDVWVERGDGGYTVKGSAEVGFIAGEPAERLSGGIGKSMM